MVKIYSLASGLHAEAMSQTARDPFIREVTAALKEADPSVEVVLRAPGTARYFLTDSIGNHHIVIPGHHAGEL